MTEQDLRDFINKSYKASLKPRRMMAGIKFLKALPKEQLKYLVNSGNLVTTTEGLEYIEKVLNE